MSFYDTMFSIRGYKSAWIRHLVISLTLIVSVMALEHGLYAGLIVGGLVYNIAAFVMS